MSDPNIAAENPVYARLLPAAGVGLYALFVASFCSELNTLEGDLYTETRGFLLILVLLPFLFGGFLLVPSKGLTTSAGWLSKWTDADDVQRWAWFRQALFWVSGAALVNHTWVWGVSLGDLVSQFLLVCLFITVPYFPWPALAAAK